MTTSESFRTRLKSFLSQITPERIVGVSGLAVLCASSVIAARPLVGSPETVALGQWFGGLGLNVLAGVLTQLYQNLLTQTSESDQAAVLKLAQGLAQGIQNHSELRREIGLFLDQMDTVNGCRILRPNHFDPQLNNTCVEKHLVAPAPARERRHECADSS